MDLVGFLRAQLDEDERVARAASGATVVGSPDSGWKPAPGGDEWEASRTDCDEDELLAALRPGLPRPPDVMSGYWGAIAEFKPAFEDPRADSPLPQFQHAARHDPARVLAEVEVKRKLLDDLLPDLQQADRCIEGEWGSSDDLAERLVKLLLAPYPLCRAQTVFWPDDEGCDAECVWPRGHGGTKHMDDTLGEWDETELHTSYPSE